MIIPGTTPTHTFTLPIEASQISCARFVYSQEGEVKVIKKDDDVRLSGNEAETTLTQEDTLKFTPGVVVSLVLRVRTLGGQALANEEPVRILCGCCHDEEVI